MLQTENCWFKVEGKNHDVQEHDRELGGNIGQ